ncbi:MAG: MmgE/PrpD family protein, partial [Alphaproteobacteria bacterium]
QRPIGMVHMTANDTPTRRIATFLAGLESNAIPEPVRRAALQQTLEIITGLFAGLDVAEMAALLDHFSHAEPAEALIPATGFRRERSAAAGAAAALSHAAESDPIHAGTAICAAAVSVPVALVLAQNSAVSGARFIAAVAGGCEAAIRVGTAIRAASLLPRGWWPTAVCGGIGAAATTSIALGMNARQTADAIGLAAVQAGGLGAGGPAAPAARNLLCAQTVRHGVEAALLAQAGISGPPEPLAGERGYLSTFCETPDAGALTDALGSRWAVADISLKAWPCALQAQTALDALATIARDNDIDPDEIRAIGIALPGPMARIVDRPGPPASQFAACASVQFLAAALLIDGDVTGARLGQGRDDRSVLALADRVRVHTDAALDARLPEAWPARVTISTATGDHTAQSDIPPGHPDRPLSFEDSADRFRRAAAPHLPPDRITRIVETVENLADLPDCGVLSDWLRPG